MPIVNLPTGTELLAWRSYAHRVLGCACDGDLAWHDGRRAESEAAS